MNPLIHLLTTRYLTQSTDTNSVSTMIYICFLSIFIGAFSLTLVNAITNGFEHTLHEKMQGIHANIIMKSHGDELNIPAIQAIISSQFPEIVASSPSTVEHALIKNPDSNTPTVTLIKAIDPHLETHTTNFIKTITETIPTHKNNIHNKDAQSHHHNLSLLLSDNHILMGSELAEFLSVIPGDTIELLHTDTSTIKKHTITLSATPALVSGLFKTGIDECDNALIVSSFDFLQTLFPESCPTQLNIKTCPKINESLLIEKLFHTFKCEVYSWKNLYPAIISALVLEKYAMFFILVLIMLVASMNSVSLLFMHITQKKADIAILKAMGTPDTTIERIFIAIGMSITLLATIPGIALAAIASYALNHYQLIALPDAYYSSYLPAHLDWGMLALVFTIIVMINFIAVKIAVRKTRTITIAHVLRFEG